MKLFDWLFKPDPPKPYAPQWPKCEKHPEPSDAEIWEAFAKALSKITFASDSERPTRRYLAGEPRKPQSSEPDYEI